MITIDGSFGEGGGQILRTSLALSMLTNQPMKIENIRAGRNKKGLLRQHLTAVKASSQICGALVEGCELHSPELFFSPREIKPGNYEFKVGTAGSATLVLQTVLGVILTAKDQSVVAVEGGTHNPFAPPFDFLQKSFLKLINGLGPKVDLRLEKFGFFPAGGGRICVEIKPVDSLNKIELLDKGMLVGQKALAFSSQIPGQIGKNEMRIVNKRLKWNEEECQALMVKSDGPGNIVMIEVEHENVTEVFTGFGEKHVSYKRVVNNAVQQFREYQESNAPVGKFLADQLLVPMAMAGGGRFVTLEPTLHTRTNIEVIKRFLSNEIRTEKISDSQWLVEIGG